MTRITSIRAYIILAVGLLVAVAFMPSGMERCQKHHSLETCHAALFR